MTAVQLAATAKGLQLAAALANWSGASTCVSLCGQLCNVWLARVLCRVLMEQYGFVVPGNPLDRVQFPNDLLAADATWMSHTAVKAAGDAVRQQQQQHLVGRHSPADNARVAAAVASILQARGWRYMQQYKCVSRDTTAHCARAMHQRLQDRLRAYETSLDQDKQLLAQLQLEHGESGCCGGLPVGKRMLAALQYRMEHKQLLWSAAAILEILR